MNLTFFLPCYLFLGGLIISAQAQEPVSLMSFNIRYDNPNDGANAWPQRKSLVESMIRYHQVDILGVQEALPHQMQDLEAMFPAYEALGEARSAASPEFCGIFYLKHRFHLVEQGTFWLSESGKPETKGWDAALPRICTYAVLTDQKTQTTFQVFNAHFDHRGAEARRKSAALIVQTIKDRQAQRRLAGQAPLPTVLMGDLNARPDEAPIQLLSAYLKDSYTSSQLPAHGPDGTWSGWEQAGEPGRRIDYLFTNEQAVPISHGTLSTSWSGRFPSDHLPVLVQCVFPPSPPFAPTHAHNDYEHERPLWDAISHGFLQVEADVWLIEGTFYVKHDRPQRLAQTPTLEALYLRPLAERVHQMHGRVYPGDSATFSLMIDLKHNGEAAYQALKKLLQPYEWLLKGPHPPLRIFLSGARPVAVMLADTASWLGIDGRPEHLGQGIPAHKMPVISQRFNKVVNWSGKGPMPVSALEKLQTLTRQAHAEGKQVRLWATPEQESLWTTLLNAGVDYINTDELARLQAYLQKRSQGSP